MNRIKYENYHGAAGYDAIARRKIKELEKKLGPQMVEKVLLDEPEAVFTEVQEGTFIFQIPSAAIVPGQTYNVEIDGEKFSCTANSASMEGQVFPYIGNVALYPPLGVPEDTGEPFLVMYAEGMLQIVIVPPATYAADPIRTFSIKITTMEEKSKDDRLSIGFFMIEEEVHCSATYAEIKDAISEAVMPVMYGDLTKLGNLPTAVLYAPDNMNPALYSVGVDFHYMNLTDASTFDSVDPQVEFLFKDQDVTKSVVMYEDNRIEYFGGGS